MSTDENRCPACNAPISVKDPDAPDLTCADRLGGTQLCIGKRRTWICLQADATIRMLMNPRT